MTSTITTHATYINVAFDGEFDEVLGNETLEIKFRQAVEDKYEWGVLRVENLRAEQVTFPEPPTDQNGVLRPFKEAIFCTLIFNTSAAARDFQERTLACSKAHCLTMSSNLKYHFLCPHFWDGTNWETYYDSGGNVIGSESEALPDGRAVERQGACDFSAESSFMTSPAGMGTVGGLFLFFLVVILFAKRARSDGNAGADKGNVISFENPMYDDAGRGMQSNPTFADDGDNSDDGGEGLYDDVAFADGFDFDGGNDQGEGMYADVEYAGGSAGNGGAGYIDVNAHGAASDGSDSNSEDDDMNGGDEGLYSDVLMGGATEDGGGYMVVDGEEEGDGDFGGFGNADEGLVEDE